MAAFARLAGAVHPHLFDLFHDATLGDPEVEAFMEEVNPEALAAMRDRFAASSGGRSLADAPKLDPREPRGRTVMGTSPMGWCPGAYRPMPVSDGLLVRIRPHLGRLTQTQVLGLADIARDCGNGLVEVTSRASFQIRGVRAETHGALLDRLERLELLDPDPATETRRSILVTPFWRPGDANQGFADGLTARLSDLPDLPAKFGFVIDLGQRPILGSVSGDIRLERGASGLIVRADGAERGRRVTEAAAVDAMVEMSHWFAVRRTPERRRMARVLLEETLPTEWAEEAPLPSEPTPPPGLHDLGALVGVPEVPFAAEGLEALLRESCATEIRLTPWRMVLVVGSQPLDAGAGILQGSLWLSELS